MSDVISSLISTVSGILGPHGPATAAAAHSYAPADFSVHFFLQLAAIVLACRVVGWLGQKVGQPQVVGEMVAGVILGPSLLGLLFPHFQGMLFPKETKNVLYVGAQLGVGLYMFMVGTSFQADHFKAKAKSAMSVSFAGIAAPFLIAALITPFLLKVPGLFAAGISQGNATLFRGACIALTAFPMLARIINERGLAKTSLGTLSLTAGAFDDAVSWCVLALVLATFGGGAGVAILAIGGGLAALMNSRGLMELIIINIGLQKGIIGPTLFSMLVLMAIITTVMASPLFEVVYGKKAREKGELDAVDGAAAQAA